MYPEPTHSPERFERPWNTVCLNFFVAILHFYLYPVTFHCVQLQVFFLIFRFNIKNFLFLAGQIRVGREYQAVPPVYIPKVHISCCNIFIYKVFHLCRTLHNPSSLITCLNFCLSVFLNRSINKKYILVSDPYSE
jgi:hypothetical protein